MKISKSTIVRSIMTLLVIINYILEKNGIDVIPFDEGTIGMFVETTLVIAVIIASWWYNNSFSQKALQAQQYLEELRESE